MSDVAAQLARQKELLVARAALERITLRAETHALAHSLRTPRALGGIVMGVARLGWSLYLWSKVFRRSPPPA